jgi:DNA invertase Pin-like site-specific DNA recombinase
MATKRPPRPSVASSARTVLYTRVSTDMQAEAGQSLDVQQHQLEGWAQMMGRTITDVVVEAGVSGGIPFAQRPEGSKLWPTLQRGDVLVASKLDRMFRSAVDCLTVADQLKQRGVSLYLLDIGNGGDDLSAGNGQSTFFLQIMAAVAQFERSRIGERIRATKQAQKARGEYLGGVARQSALRKHSVSVSASGTGQGHGHEHIHVDDKVC